MDIPTEIKAKIRQNHDFLIRELDTETIKSVCDYLYQEDIFDRDKIDMIDAERTRIEKARKFLSLMACESEDANLKFVERLENAAQHLAETIRTTEIQDSEETEETAEVSSFRQMQEWSVNEVCLWLKKLDMDQNVIGCLREQKISGTILATIRREEIAEFGPDIVFGDRVKLIQLRDAELVKQMNPCETSLNSTSESENTDCSEEIFVSTSFRNFGRKTDSAIPVTQNTYFPSESTAVDDLIEPVHRYLAAQNLDNAAAKREFSMQIIPFICACLNDRTNGTFHLGVNKDGKIHGIVANIDEFQELLNELMEKSFSPDQLDAVKNCVRPVRLVSVVTNAQREVSQEADKLHLVEVDVVASHSLCTDQAFFAKALKPNSNPGPKAYERTKVFRFQNGLHPVPISDETLALFMDSKPNLARRRQEAEQEHLNAKPKQQTTDLGKKLIRLICHGGNSLDDANVYPIFVMSSAPELQSNAEDFIENTKFINSVERKTVFDFDDATIPTSIFLNHAQAARVPSQVFVVSSSEAASGKQQDGRLIASLQDCLSSGSACQPWIFCNGYEDTQDKAMGVLEWNRARRSDFLKVLDVLDKATTCGHFLVVFLLFSENCDVLLRAAKEFCLKFKGNWVLICETQEVATKFKDYLINTAEVVADEKEFNRHSVVGMPWLHVSQAISGISGDLTSGEVRIPTSSGTPIVIPREVLNELHDIEVIGSNHLSDIPIDENARTKLDLEKEQSFYQGKEVDWWNFFFNFHVLKREKLEEILSCTRSVLSGTYNQETDDFVDVVVIDHQPGSGATTLAKNVLWELKTEYRCATLRAFTNDTANQLSQLRKYGEPSNRKPVLLLADNIERVHELKESLETEARKLAAGIKNCPGVIFVLLVVSRCTSNEEVVFTREKTSPQFYLGHSLTPAELQLFSRKFDDMERDSKKRKRLDPRFLLSFNILRNNFSEDYIKRTVPGLVRLVSDPRERKLLEYVAFVGVFDPGNNSIPASCFDWLMCQGETIVDSAWLSKMSRYLKLLVNDDSRDGDKLRMKGIRVIHSSLAQEIYTVLAGNRLVSEVCLEFLQSDIFLYLSSSTRDLHNVINNITVKRIKGADGKCQTNFSMLVEKIRESAEDDTAKIEEILELAFKMTDNVYIAQHTARFFISLKEWKKAEQWAVTATDMQPNKEVLWNTYAHVFSDQFNQKFPDGPVSAKTIEDSLELAIKAMNLYRHEQYVNDREIGNNPTGLLYEGGTIVELMKLLERIPELKGEEIRVFLVTSYIPQCFQNWKRTSLQIVKTLKDRAALIQAELEEDKYRQDKDRTFNSLMPYEMKRLKERMIKITESFDNYFGVDSNETPKHLQPEEAASYRRSRIFRLKGNTFSRILEHCGTTNVAQQLHIIRSLAEENVKTPFRNATDLQTFIGASISLFFLSEESVGGDNSRLLKHLTKLSQELLRMGTSSENNSAPLEPYMFFALLNWPTSSSESREQDVSQIEDVLARWKDAYQARNPVPFGKSQSSRGLGKILFFLGSNDGMNRIVPFNRKENASLATFQGTLVNEGQEVKFLFKTEHREYCIGIETVEVENTKSRWNKKVSFEVGFRWAGPVAYVISTGDSRRTPADELQRSPTADFRRSTSGDMQNQTGSWNQTPSVRAEYPRYLLPTPVANRFPPHSYRYPHAVPPYRYETMVPAPYRNESFLHQTPGAYSHQQQPVGLYDSRFISSQSTGRRNMGRGYPSRRKNNGPR